MAKVSIIGFAVGGAFLSLAYWDMPFYIMVILVCTNRLVGETLAQASQPKAVSAPIHQTSVASRPGEEVILATPSPYRR